MYQAPVSEISFTLNHAAGLGKALEDRTFGELSPDLVDAILSEAGKFASEEIAPLNTVGDTKLLPLVLNSADRLESARDQNDLEKELKEIHFTSLF